MNTSIYFGINRNDSKSKSKTNFKIIFNYVNTNYILDVIKMTEQEDQVFDREKEVYAKIQVVTDEKELLEVVYDYFIGKKSVAEIANYKRFNVKEFEEYLLDNHYPRLFSAEEDEVKQIMEKRHDQLDEILEKIRKKETNYHFELLQQMEAIKAREEIIQQEIDKRINQIKEREKKRSEEIYRQKEEQRIKEMSETEEFEKKELEDRIERKAKEEKIYIQREKSVLGSLNQILFIPSWSKLISNEFKGFYLNQNVTEIMQDSIIILPDVALTGFEETMGEPFFFLTGVGIFYTKFRLGKDDIITDYREITGIVLPMDYYDRAQNVSGSVLNSEKLLMTEYLVSIPFSLLLEEQTTQMYMRGVVARNVVHPYKECWNKLLEICKDVRSFHPDDGLKILSGGMSTKIPLYSNELLTEKDLGEYSRLTAGIKNVQPKLGKILTDLQIVGDFKVQLFEKIRMIKEDYVKKGYPKLLDWVP